MLRANPLLLLPKKELRHQANRAPIQQTKHNWFFAPTMWMFSQEYARMNKSRVLPLGYDSKTPLLVHDADPQ